MSTAAQADVQATFCATLVDEWVRCGVAHAIVAPGSRSTPMALALAADPRIEVQVHHDERSAAFIALGVGLASGHPALVLTTSGTATAHLHPAVIEAHQACIPLIALTADRPPELQQVGAPQTVDQAHLYGRSVRWFADVGVPDAATAPTWRSLAARAVAEATTGPAGPGPVQLNLPFREPLVGEPGPLPAGRPDGARWHTTVGRRFAVDRRGTERLGQLLDADRGVIVAGEGAGEPEVVLALSAATGWPVLADPRSGVRAAAAPEGAPGTVVAAFDAILRHGPTAGALRPEVVLRLGGPPASKELARWIAGAEAVVVGVDAHGRWFDPEHQAAHVLHADPTAVASALARIVGGREGGASWAAQWSSAEAAAQGAIDATLATEDLPTEPGVARTILDALPAGATLVVSSSMPVRDLEWYGSAGDVRVLANRGANGIDGVVSTAIGAALVGRRTGAATAVLLGDVALLHDANALLGLAARELDLTIVAIDNDGGGIFSFLPQAEALPAERFEQLFGTPHGVDLSVLAAAHGLVTVEPAGAADVATAISACAGAGGARLVRIATDRQANVALHRRIHEAVADALA